MNRLLRNLGPILGCSALVFLGGLVVAIVSTDHVVRGLAIGGSLGIVNLLLGSYFTRRALLGEPGAVMVSIAAGFAARFLVLAGLLFAFTVGDAVSPAAFGLTFLAFVFAYFAVEFTLAFRMKVSKPA